MTAEDRKQQENCPFWSEISAKCRICDNGLFIPLDNHAEAYCKTSCYPGCPQYTHYSENHIYLPKKVRISEENRRRSLRVATSHAIPLIKIFGEEGLISTIANGAYTIDVSKNGMRVATSKPLTYDALVQFSFDDSFPLDIEDLTGQVEWCNKQVDDPGYQAGVSFRGNELIAALEHLHTK